MDKRYKDLLEKASFLVELGSPIKSNVEYQRSVSKALGDLHIAILNCKYNADFTFSMTEEEEVKAIELAKANAIRKVIIDQNEIL